MTDGDPGFGAGLAVGAVISFVIMIVSMLLLEKRKDEQWRAEAVAAGVAERTIDQETGEVGFRFLSPERTDERVDTDE